MKSLISKDENIKQSVIYIGFIILSVQGRLTSDYTNIFLVIITFYFGKESGKNFDSSNKD